MNFISTHSPIGDITLFQDADSIVALEGGWAGSQQDAPTPLLKEAIRQFHAYFTGALTSFDLPLAPPGSSFQQDICQRIQEIPYGETRTYKDIATQFDSKTEERKSAPFASTPWLSTAAYRNVINAVLVNPLR